MTEFGLPEIFTRLSEKANLFKQYAQRTVSTNTTYLLRLCRRRTSKLASAGGICELAALYTVALGYCLNRFALSESDAKRCCTVVIPNAALAK